MNQILDDNGSAYVVFYPKGADGEADKDEDKGDWPLILINGDKDLLDFMRGEKLLPLTHAVAVMALSPCRQDDFTPWPEPPLNTKFPAFGGKADEWLLWLKHGILPAVREKHPVSREAGRTALLGQSLGGLLALYAQMTDCANDFGRIAAVSPSCWYPEFLERFKRDMKPCPDTAFYISCGTAEGERARDIKRNMVSNNRKLLEFLVETQGAGLVTSYWDDGGHKDYLSKRYQKAFLWLQSGLS